jgi:hypothetical protein
VQAPQARLSLQPVQSAPDAPRRRFLDTLIDRPIADSCQRLYYQFSDAIHGQDEGRSGGFQLLDKFGRFAFEVGEGVDVAAEVEHGFALNLMLI